MQGRTHGCKGSLLNIREGKYERELGRHRRNLEAGAFKTYANLWEGRNQVISIHNQWVGRNMEGSWPGGVFSELKHGQSELQYFSMSPKFSLTLACLSRKPF
jgi:hypothetical protein